MDIPTPYYPLAFILGTFTTIGGIANLIIIAATIHSKSTCNILIAFSSLADFCHLQGQWHFIVFCFTKKEIPQHSCYYSQFISVAGMYYCGPMTLAVATDRFVAVAFPMEYMRYQHHTVSFALTLLFPPTLYVVSSIIYGFFHTKPDLVPCSMPAAFDSLTNPILDNIYYGSYIVTAIVYIIVVIFVKTKGADSQFRAVFRSISVILIIIFLTFVGTNVVYEIPNHVKLTDYQIDLVYQYSALGINFSIAVNGFIFYSMNAQYRSAVNRLFGFKAQDNILIVSRTG